MTVQMQLAQFAAWCMEEGPWNGCDLDGGDLQDAAIKFGIIKQVPYDPAKHGENEYDVEPGDPWYEYSDELKRLLTSYRVRSLPPGECKFCDQHRSEKMMPSHDASERCESGKRPHCTCDVCF